MSGFIVQDSTRANEWTTWTEINFAAFRIPDDGPWPRCPDDTTDLDQMVAWLREMNRVTMLVEFRIVCEDGRIFGSEVA